MKNPFVKENHTVLVTAITMGTLTAGALAYLFMTESGTNVRGKISDNLSEGLDNIGRKVKEGFKDITAGIISNKTNISKKTVKAAANHVVK